MASIINQKQYFRDEKITVFSGLKAATFPPQISPCDLPVDYSGLTAFRGRPSQNRKSERDGKDDTKTTLVSSVACTNHFTIPGFRGKWRFGEPGEVQEASSGSDSGQFEIPSDILNDRKQPERLWFRCVAAAPFDTLKLQKLRNNKGNNKAKPSGASRWFPPPEAISETPPSLRRALSPASSAVGGRASQVWDLRMRVGWSEQPTVMTRRRTDEKERRKSYSPGLNCPVSQTLPLAYHHFVFNNVGTWL